MEGSKLKGRGYVLFLVRLVAGIIFIVHGYGKLFGSPGLEGFGGYLASFSFPIAGTLALVIGLLEFFGGMLLILGIFSRFVSLLYIIELVVIILFIRLGNGFGAMELDLLLLASVLSVYVSGLKCCKWGWSKACKGRTCEAKS